MKIIADLSEHHKIYSFIVKLKKAANAPKGIHLFFLFKQARIPHLEMLRHVKDFVPKNSQ